MIRRSVLVLVAVLMAVSAASAAAPRPGSVDERFGDQGRRSDLIGCLPLSVAGVERAESGGGIRVIGTTERSADELTVEGGRLIIRGYDRRGGLDRAMVGGTGTVLVPLPGGRAKAWGVARQPDGKLVVVGSVGEDSGQDIFVARFYSDGSLDAAFGSGGVVTTDLGAVALEAAWDVAVQPDGRLVVAASGLFESGAPYATRSTELVVLRYGSNGVLDPGFASGGVLHVPSQSFESYFFVRGLGLARDGTIFVGGERGLTYKQDSNAAVIARVHADGSLDRIVAAGGVGDPQAMSVDHRHGRIYLAGSSPRVPGGNKRVMSVAAVRVDDLGVDTRFGTRGFARADFPKTDYDFASSVISDRRGRVVLAGGAATVPAPRSRFAVARFTPAGRLDRHFGRRGLARVGFPYRMSVAYGVLEQPAGRLVLAGIGASASTDTRPATGCALAVARLAAH